MYKLVCITLGLLMTSAVSAQQPKQQNIEHVSNCFRGAFSDYASWVGFMEKRLTARGLDSHKVKKRLSGFTARFPKANFNEFKQTLSCQTFTYHVDGRDVAGYVIKPKHVNEKLPVIIYNRGGNGNYGAVVFGSMMANLFPLAKEGFVIVGSQYRGTFTQEENLDEFGGQDVNDVIALMDIISQFDGADPQRVGMFGASRGAMQTHLAMKQISGVKAVATIAGVVDLNKELTFRPEMEKVYSKRIPNYHATKAAQLARRSVINWVKELPKNVPILLIHGDSDKRVSVENSVRFAEALEKEKIPNKLVVYKGDNHYIERNEQAAFAELSEWFHTHL
ncbi:prolyl oligopeptidase family serine peptidase [Pseudoalteromonas sp. DL2-H2.2]|uniref:alpha/beta hydrolase family protein n=1 Tax=Pseudoalteromonas sp. DL2-H2.2 TaxID=2908889 RepID=UPI001F24CA3A|nr:prolyl oligopeptidase family serine peptidase [Pseudoalteromonas sp. DL2-H2.2]MCF2909507.1 prolyl oligopeptidase family serine peptidase [Pseudoalteromonas sp. DL2-H2.2]